MNLNNKALWVKVKEVHEKTEFDTHKKLERARKFGYIEYKKKDGIWYNLTSVNPQFLKKLTQ